jgi:hypothetical protein
MPPCDLSGSGTIPPRAPDLFCYPPSRTESVDSRLPSYRMSGRSLVSDQRAGSFRKDDSRKRFVNVSGDATVRVKSGSVITLRLVAK